MKTRIEQISVTRLFMNDSESFKYYDCRVFYLVRYGEYDVTEVALDVRLPVKDYSISELKAAAFEKAKDSLLQLHQADYAATLQEDSE